MSLAQAMMEYIHEEIGANTLFSTHYHELTDLENELARLQNVHVSATEQDGRVVFLHKVKKGAADKSYGVHVAELANMPQAILNRARVLLEQFEANDVQTPKIAPSQTKPVQPPNVVEPVVVAEEEVQLSLFQIGAEPAISPEQQEVLDTLAKLNVMGTTPMQAMTTLYELQQKLQGNK